MKIYGRSKVQNKVLRYFFLHEKESVYINALARLIEEDPKNVYRILCRLEEQGILVSEFKGKQRYFKINEDNPLTAHFKEIFFKTDGIEFLIEKDLKRLGSIEQAVIFGSYASGQMDQHSDIDLLVVTNQSAIDIQKCLAKTEKYIGRDISAIVVSPRELKKKFDVEPFFQNIMTQKNIFIIP